MATSALSLKNISYAYTTDWLQKKMSVIKNLSLDIPAGEAFGFLGHNGAGKTTTIKCILGLARPQEGEITINGRSFLEPESHEAIGYLPEQPYFYDNISVKESLTLAATLSSVPVSDVRDRVSELLEAFHLAPKQNHRMKTLSKGLMQRVGMAQALIGDPDILILDEPFSGLDPIGRKELRDLLLQLKAQGKTIFMCTHILSDVEAICDRASVMVRGELRGVYSLADQKIEEVFVKLHQEDQKLFGGSYA